MLLNTADSDVDADVVAKIEALGLLVVAGPLGLELEVAELPDDERELFAQEMGLGEPSREKVLRAIFKLTDMITFYTSGEKEVHAWLLKRGSNAVEAADSIHSDLARGFIRAEIQSVDDLLRLGSEREVKAAGLHHSEGKGLHRPGRRRDRNSLQRVISVWLGREWRFLCSSTVMTPAEPLPSTPQPVRCVRQEPDLQ